MELYDQLDPFVQDRAGRTALHHALNASRTLVADLLVDMGVEVTAVDYFGTSAIHSALANNNFDFAMKRLPAVDTIRHRSFRSILNTAALTGSVEVVEELLRRAPPSTGLQEYLNLSCPVGTPLYSSVIWADSSIAEKLIEKGAEINLVGGPLGTALIAACSMGKLEAVILLLRKGAELECVQHDGTIITAEAAAKQHDQVLSLLERFRMKGMEALDEPIPAKQADIGKMEETLAALEARKCSPEETGPTSSVDNSSLT
jgi:ankyrin repeat protein